MPENDRAFGKRLDNLFKIGAPDWAEGFELALDMGESVAPPLTHKLILEKNQKRRLLWIAAYGLASRSPQRLYQSLKLKGSEKSLAMFVLAIGPIHAEGAGSVRRALGPSADTAEIIATCLALARFEDRDRGVPKRLFASQDPGEFGSALYVNPSLSHQEILSHLRSMRAKAAHLDLVWRGYYLATARTAAEKKTLPSRRTGALEALTAGSKTCKAAALLLARSGPAPRLTRKVLEGLDDETAVILALSPALRVQLLEAGRIGSEPSPTQSREEIRRRQVVLFACSAPLPMLRRAVLTWPRTCGDLMDEICLALAFRLSQSEPDRKALVGILGKLGRVEGSGALTEAGIWLRLAQHQDLRANEPRVRLAELPRLLRLALRGALTDATRARAVERILWERGSHPGLSGLELHRAFVFDLLLAHAAAAGSQPDPYVPKGMLATGNDFLLVVNRLFKFICTREPWALREYRLSL